MNQTESRSEAEHSPRSPRQVAPFLPYLSTNSRFLQFLAGVALPFYISSKSVEQDPGGGPLGLHSPPCFAPRGGLQTEGYASVCSAPSPIPGCSARGTRVHISDLHRPRAHTHSHRQGTFLKPNPFSNHFNQNELHCMWIYTVFPRNCRFVKEGCF